MSCLPTIDPGNTHQIEGALVTPSALTNNLIACCIAYRNSPNSSVALQQALDECATNTLAARDAFYNQIQEHDLERVIPKPIAIVIESFQDYAQALNYTSNSITDPNNYPIDSAVVLIHDSYQALYDALLSYEWAYLGQGEEPHPVLNLLQKVISAAQQQLMSDERLNDILDRLWNYFINEQDDAERSISDEHQRYRKVNAIQQVLSGIGIMDGYFESYDINYLLTGYSRCHQGCLLIIEQLQETTGEALADAPTPSPQVNWVIHTAKAVIDGLNPDLLIKAQSWFEPQLNESFFRFEQYTSMALKDPNTPRRVLEQIPIARDGFDRLNRALPLIRLGLERRQLLVRAIKNLEDGAKMIFQAWEAFEDIEKDNNTVACIHCGYNNDVEDRICNNCGASLIKSNMEEQRIAVSVSSNYPNNENSRTAQEPYYVDESASIPSNFRPPAHIARLLNAIEGAKSGRTTLSSFASDVAWGKQLLRTAIQNTARLPQGSPDRSVDNALRGLRQGLHSFNEAINEMESYLADYHPNHLNCASRMLYDACKMFTSLQKLSTKQ